MYKKESPKLLQIACELTEMQGGPTRVAIDLCGYLPDNHEFLIVGLIDKKSKETLDGYNYNYRNIKADFGNLSGLCLRELPRLIGQIQRNSFVISHGFYTFPTFLLCFFAGNKNVLIMPHGSLEEYQGKQSKFKKSIFDFLVRKAPNFDKVLFSVATVEETKSINKKFKSNRVEVVGIGVDIPEVKENYSASERTEFNLLSISRIANKKRIDTSIRATALLQSKKIDALLWIYGDGDKNLVRALKNLAEELGISKKVHFIGSVNHEMLEEVFLKGSMLLLPSENENFAIAVAESIAHNVPVVVSRAVALSDFVESNNCGEVIESSDPDLLCEAILKVKFNRHNYATSCNLARSKLSHAQVEKNWKVLLQHLSTGA
jgi:glycosyltransferase involved in cell wall biosynthesis